ncbi:GAF domain-containing protein [Phototrophicus methaneseepsis]|uniref:histidine kinase n=1 Tax=Phototrophicus methaneseepsis TaxID=2710758 RepID=A0A7S8EAR1_9CHLR|nr:ATP-binding protein [Phototrophicus methaneseepsis]QPC83495.1 GAF domain-containing protein [Phototrophicus methaneseepsis]
MVMVQMDAQALQQRVQQLESQVNLLEKLVDVSVVLNSRLQLEPLLKYIMDVAVDIMECDAASVLLWNNKKQQLFFAASTTLDNSNSLIGTPVPMDSIAGEILRKRDTVRVDDARTDPRHYGKVDEDIAFQTRSLLGVPMTYKNKIIGVLEALNKRQGSWTKEDSRYLEILAAQAAVAIEGAQAVMELRRANEELNEVDRLKNNFIAIASHELRTPLGVIMGYASFLQEDEDVSTQSHASKVLESALRLRKIIEDMVNLRYVKQKQSDLHLEAIRVSELFSSLSLEIQALMDIDKYQINIKMPDKDPYVYADHTRMMMVLTNLINNAISFSAPDKPITVEALKGLTDKEVRLRVVDQGLGIDPTQLEKIFEEFYQVEDHMVRHHGGLGIGLSIGRAIVEAHGGRIWAESAGIGSGATFTISLPTIDPPQEDINQADTSQTISET